jgi:hypothetical protein
VRIRWGVLCLLLAIPITASAHAEIFFPKLFSTDELPNTGFVFLNPDPVIATVSVYLISRSGSRIASPAPLTIAPGGQATRLGSQLFPNAPAPGWVYVFTDTESMQAFWLNYNSDLTFLDGSDAAQYETIGGDQIIALVAGQAELNIINPNFARQSVTIRLFGSDGELAPAFTTDLPIAGAFQSDVSAIFPSVDMSRARYIRIRSASLTIASTIWIRGFLVPTDSVAMNGQNVGSQTELTFAHAVSGPLGGANYTSVLGVTNPGTSAQTITLTFNPDGGDPLTVIRTLSANGALRETVQDLFQLSPTFQNGWIRVSGTAPITGFLAYADTIGGGVAAVPAGAAQSKLFFAHIADGEPQWQTGLAIVNADAAATEIDMYAVAPGGGLIGFTHLSLDPGRRVAKVIHEFIPETQGVNGGFVFIRTTNNVPVYGIELFYTQDLKIVSSVAAAKLKGGVSYTPPTR